MAEDQTKEENPQDQGETSTETAENDTQKNEVDYKTKFVESQKEAIRLAKENKELKAKEVEKPAESTQGESIDQIVEKKVKEQFAPITKQQQEAQVDTWIAKNPDAVDHLAQIEDTYQNMPGKTVAEKLENAFLVAKKDTMKAAGKKEMGFAIYQKEQASTGGGGASGSAGESLPELTSEEITVAQKLGIKPDAYAKNKSEK